MNQTRTTSRTRRITPVLIAAFVASTSLFAAAPVLDQSAPADPTASFTWALGGSSNQLLAQTLTVGISGKLVEVRVPIGCGSGAVIVEIRDVDSSTGEPGTTVLARRRYRADFFPGVVTATFEPLRLGGRAGVTAGDRVAIVLSNPTGSCGVQPGPSGDPYAGGTGYSQDDLAPGVWIRLNTGAGATDDLPFQSWVRASGSP